MPKPYIVAAVVCAASENDPQTGSTLRDVMFGADIHTQAPPGYAAVPLAYNDKPLLLWVAIASNGAEKVTLGLEWVAPNGAVIGTIQPGQRTLTADPVTVVTHFLDGCAVPETGLYHINVVLNGERVRKIPFFVSRSTVPGIGQA